MKILDEQGRSVRRGSIGELFIGGAGVGLGYITHDSRMAGRYLRALPGQRPGRWYRTGDLASFDGKYYKLHGRADARIKVKGRFVDLVEVEGVLREHCDVLDCAITTVPDGDELNLAVAIATAPGAVPNPGQLSDFLQRKTGQAVMANHIWFVPKLPATLSGKVDRRALHVLATGQLMGGA
ncbi:AMP-binding protein [Mycetohabitans sp. B8]|uniref:AMP-binding enzyme n=1 Tax=Mycetohabitans sp. B8 TaxID=2841845 RepID=UPI001F3EDA70|nr:AMP-binding protein [Mycetohabitans sp. B8]